MISDRMQKAFNDQINAEFYSAYLYLSMSVYFEDAGMEGFASWMQVQYLEEQSHAMKMLDYVCERGGRVHLSAIDAPPTEWKSAEDVFVATFEHEKKVSGLINSLMSIAREENDYASESFLRWFVDEQVEEEASAEAVVNKMKMVGGAGHGLFMLDRELGQRTFTEPAGKEE